MTSIYDFKMKDYLGHEVDFADFRDKVLLIVNTATKCGFTKQYNGLQELYESYKDRGFVVLDFPCNQFRNQAPEGSSEIAQECQTKFGVEFPIFEKIKVNGPEAAPLFQYLKEEQPKDQGGSAIKGFITKLASIGEEREGSDITWNFTKFLVNKEGQVIGRFSPSMEPKDIRSEIEKVL